MLSRTTREVNLSDTARVFLKDARRTLAKLELAGSDARRAGSGELTISQATRWLSRMA